MKKTLAAIAILLAATVTIIQFIPAPEVMVPAQLPSNEREQHRLLNFEGIHNFRDLGGYPASDGRAVKWGLLYRTGTLAHASRADLAALANLDLNTLIDFRSEQEKDEEPNRLPEPLNFAVVEIPTLDKGNETLVAEIFERIETGNFDGFEPAALMVTSNRQFATEFTPQFAQFIDEVQHAKGAPVAFHCSAGKDRTGFAAAILLRILGVSPQIIMQDYMASLEPSLAARKNTLKILRLMEGDEAADKLEILMGVEESWLQAAFDEIDQYWGDFDSYVRNGLGLSESDVMQLRNTLLE